MNYDSLEDVHRFISSRYMFWVKKGIYPDFFVCDNKTLSKYIEELQRMFGSMVSPCKMEDGIELQFPCHGVKMYGIPSEKRFINEIVIDSWKWE